MKNDRGSGVDVSAAACHVSARESVSCSRYPGVKQNVSSPFARESSVLWEFSVTSRNLNGRLFYIPWSHRDIVRGLSHHLWLKYYKGRLHMHKSAITSCIHPFIHLLKRMRVHSYNKPLTPNLKNIFFECISRCVHSIHLRKIYRVFVSSGLKCVSVVPLPGNANEKTTKNLWRWPNIKPTVGQRLVFAWRVHREKRWSRWSNMRRRSNVDLMLAHRLRRRPNIKSALFNVSVCWEGCRMKDEVYCLTNMRSLGVARPDLDLQMTFNPPLGAPWSLNLAFSRPSILR